MKTKFDELYVINSLVRQLFSHEIEPEVTNQKDAHDLIQSTLSNVRMIITAITDLDQTSDEYWRMKRNGISNLQRCNVISHYYDITDYNDQIFSFLSVFRE